MESKIQLLDCTLRDGCYIVSAEFGTPVMRGILKKLTAANVDIIECGWLKDSAHKPGTAFYHVPADAQAYLPQVRRPGTVYAAMIDWDRYDLGQLPPNDGRGIDAIRMVFPHGKFKEAIPLGRKIREQGYRLFFQAANTLGYSDPELVELDRIDGSLWFARAGREASAEYGNLALDVAADDIEITLFRKQK